MTDAAEVKTLVKALNAAAGTQGPTAAEVRSLSEPRDNKLFLLTNPFHFVFLGGSTFGLLDCRNA